LKKTIKNHCINPTQSKLDELYKIGQKYSDVKNEIFNKYGSIAGLKYLSYPRQIRDSWVKTGYADKFGLQARQWKQAFDEAFSNINSMWSNAINNVKSHIYKNNIFTEDEKHYAFYILKAKELLSNAIAFKDFPLPEKFKDLKIRRYKIHQYLKRRLRKCVQTKPKQRSNRVFQLDSCMYDIYKDSKNKLWIGIMSLMPRKRIKLQMTSDVEPSGNIRIVLKHKTVEIHHVIEVGCSVNKSNNIIAIDKGFVTAITSSSGEKYGKDFNVILKAESDRLSEKSKKRNKLFALAKKNEEKGNVIKAGMIKKNNLGNKKNFCAKEINSNKIKAFINTSLNKFFIKESPSLLVTENLTFTSWNKILPKKVKRYLSSWLKGYLQERINYKTMLNGVQQVVVNAAYSSQTHRR